MNELKDIRDRQAWGSACVIFGVVLGNTIYEFFGRGIDLVNLFMLLGVVLIIDYNRLLHLQLPGLKKKTLILYAFQFFILFLFVFFRHELATGSVSADMSYIFFAIALITAMASNSSFLRWTKVIKISFFLSTGILLVITYVLFTNGNVFNGRFRFSSGADPLQMGVGLTSCFAVFLLYEGRSIWDRILKMLDIGLLIIAEFAFSCRTAIFICLIMLIIWLIQRFRINLISQKAAYKAFLNLLYAIFGFFVIFCIVYNFVPGIKNTIDSMGEYMLRGVLTLYGNYSMGIDESASTRVYTQKAALDLILNESNPLKILFGHGYMTMYVDVPLLQALLDFGCIGWVLYAYIVIFNPIRTILSREKIERASENKDYCLQYMAFSLLAVTAIGKQLSSALPYGHDVYLGAILCWFLA